MLFLWELYGNVLSCLFTLPWSTCLLSNQLMCTGKAGRPSATTPTSCYGFAPQACPFCLQPCGRWTGPNVSSLRWEWVNEYKTQDTTVQSTGSSTRTSVTAVQLCVVQRFTRAHRWVCFSLKYFYHLAVKEILHEHKKIYWGGVVRMDLSHSENMLPRHHNTLYFNMKVWTQGAGRIISLHTAH